MKVVLAHGFLGLFDYFPLFFIAAAVIVILNVLRDGQRRATHGARRLPTNHWSRQVATATRKRGPATQPPSDQPVERPEKTRRAGAGPPHLRVLDGEAAEKPAPRKFEPPPAGRSQAG